MPVSDPRGFLNWSDDEKAQVAERLRERGHLGRCANCNHEDWFLNLAPAWITIGAMHANRGHAHAHMVCRRCGTAKLVSLWAIDLPALGNGFE